MWLPLVLLLTVLAPAVLPVQTGWRPILGPTAGPTLGPALGPTLGPLGPRALGYPQPHYPRGHSAHHPGVCTLYKAVMDQDTFQQYVQYKSQIPDLKEFTLCLWHKVYNHTQDHPLFYYGHREKNREIFSWVANSDSSSFYMFAVNGQTLYRLNYPLRMHKWYHVCQSWNGKTGEWQIWVNAERIGRGFHNLLVGKPIKGGGMAITGQEQQGYNSGNRGKVPRNKVSGLIGEITLVQLYKAALTAGKAYTNHKHHHVHHFHHEDKPGQDDYDIASPSPSPLLPFSASPTPTPPPPQTSQHPFLSNGQLIPMLPVTDLSAFRGQADTNLGLFMTYNPQMEFLFPGSQRLFKRDQSKSSRTPGKRRKKSEETESESDDIDIVQEDILKVEPKESKKVKRDTKKAEAKSKPVREEEILEEVEEKKESPKKRQTLENTEMGEMDMEMEDKNHKKRTLFHEQLQYGLIPGDDLSDLFPGNGYVLGSGGVKFDGSDNNAPPMEEVQMEPAEWEVRSIMAVCSQCSEDPFRKANIISWRESPKKLYAGAMYVPAVPECQRF